MKFINYLTSISGIGIFPLISLLIFFLFFLALTVYMLKADKGHIRYMSTLPVETENDDNSGAPQNKQNL